MQKTHTDDVSLPRSRSTSDDFVVPYVKFTSTYQKHYPDLGSDASSVWNFCTFFSDVISQGNQWWLVKCCLANQAKYLLVYKCNARESSTVS